MVRFSRSRKRYERQGVLVEPAALEAAEVACLADEEARGRRRVRDEEPHATADVEFEAAFAGSILELFPGCTTRTGDQDRGACRPTEQRTCRPEHSGQGP